MKLADPTLLRDQCYVDGAWIGKGADPVENPATGEILAKVPHFGKDEALAAVTAAHAAFPAWSKRTAKDRAALLKKWYELILANKEDLALIMTSEQGKPLAEAKGEIEFSASFVELFAEEAKRIYGETIPSPRTDSRVIVLKQPIGVIAAITPWNFPAAMITRKLAPAIAVGCTAVLKPAPETPLTALALVELAHRAGIPKGVVNVITGDAPAIGEVFTGDPRIRLIAFTGSTDVGKLLMRQAASTVKKVALELGGNAPFIVFDDADIDAAVEGAMFSKYRNMGQTCICANRIYVQDKIYDVFVEKFSAAVMKLKVGKGTEVGVLQGPLINMKAVEKVERHIADAVQGGAKVMVGGKRHSLGRTFFEPTVLSGVTTRMLVTREETFGPLAPVYKFATEQEAIDMANATQFGLAAYFFGRDVGRCFRVAEALEYGMIGVNTGSITFEGAPFGGVKESGIGREGSHHGVEEFLEMKYLMLGGIH